MNIVKFMLRAKEDFNAIISEMDNASYIKYLTEMDGAAHGYLDCINTFLGVMAGEKVKTEDSIAFDLEDVLSEWYDILNERTALARNRLLTNLQTVHTQAKHKPENQPPVDRGKLLIGLEVCRKQMECCECPYYNRKHTECKNISEDSLSYICYLEEQLKEARKHDCG